TPLFQHSTPIAKHAPVPRANASICRKRGAKAIVDAELHLADALTDTDVVRPQQWIIECHGATAEIQVIIFKFDRPILPYCPLHARADSPADARLGGAEVKWRDDRRIRKYTRRGRRNELHQTASGGRDLAVELILVVRPSGAPLGIDHTLAQTTEGVAEPARRSGNEISSRGSESSGAHRSRCDGPRAD